MPRGANSYTPEQLEKMKEYETWFKIVVKILRWKDGATELGDLSKIDKVSQKEWKTYCETILKKNIVFGKKKTQEKLDETWKKIQQYHCFEK